LRRRDRRHAASGGCRARLVAGKGEQGRAPQCGAIAFDFGQPETLFPIALASANGRTRFNLPPDGTGFLVLSPKGDGAGPPTTVVLNWQTVLTH